MILMVNAFRKLNVLQGHEISDLLLGHENLNRNLGWVINYFGKFLENHPPPYIADTL